MAIKNLLFVLVVFLSVSRCQNQSEKKATEPEKVTEPVESEEPPANEEDEMTEPEVMTENTDTSSATDTITEPQGDVIIDYKAFEAQIKELDKYIEDNPKDADAYRKRGDLKQLVGDLPGACKDWKKSMKLGNTFLKITLEKNCD